MRKSLMFGQQPWIIPLENVYVLHFLKVQFSGLKIILFYPKDQKIIFTDLFSPKNTNKKNFDFWPKKMDYPLRNDHFCRPFKTLFFWSKNHSFLSRISKTNIF